MVQVIVRDGSDYLRRYLFANMDGSFCTIVVSSTREAYLRDDVQMTDEKPKNDCTCKGTKTHSHEDCDCNCKEDPEHKDCHCDEAGPCHK